MTSPSISRTHQIILEQESFSFGQRVNTGEVLALISSIANGAFIGSIICFTFSNPAGWVVTVTILSGALVGVLVCSIGIFSYRHFSRPESDGIHQNIVHDQVNDEQSELNNPVNSNSSTENYSSMEIEYSDDSDSQPFLLEKQIFQNISNEDEPSALDPFSELQKKLIFNLLDDSVSAKQKPEIDLTSLAAISSLQFLNSYGFNKSIMQNYAAWMHIWESDSIPRYPHLLNSLLTIDIKKMDGKIVKGFIYDGRPFIAFKINMERVNVSDESSSEKQKPSKPQICMFYGCAPIKGNKKMIYATKIFESEGLSHFLKYEQFKALMEVGELCSSESRSCSDTLESHPSES